MASSLQIVEEKILLKWVNDVLSAKNLKVAVFPEDLTNGIALANLYEILTKKPFGKLEKTKIEVQKIINVNKVIKLFQDDGVTVTASGESIVKGNKKNILSLLWCIFRRYQDLNTNSLFAFFAKERITFSTDRVGEEKLAWVVQDGTFLCALVKQVAPQIAEIQLDQLNKENALDNVNLALDMADKYLNIKCTLPATEVASGKADENALLDYISCFLKDDLKKANDINVVYPTMKKSAKIDPVVIEEMGNIQNELIELQNQIIVVTNEKQFVENQVKQLTAKNADLQKQCISKEGDVQRISLDLEEVKITADSEKRAWLREKENLEKEIEKLIEERDSHVCSTEGEPNMDAINKQVAELEEKLKQAQLELQRKEEENLKLENDLKEAKKQHEHYAAVLEELQKTKRRFERELEFLNDRVAEETDSAADYKNQIAKLKEQMETVQVEENEVMNKKAKNDKSSKELEKELKKATEEKEKMSKELKKTEEKLQKVIATREKEVQKLKKKLEEESSKRAKKEAKQQRNSVDTRQNAQYDLLVEENSKANQIIESLKKDLMKVKEQKDILEREKVQSQLNNFEKDIKGLIKGRDLVHLFNEKFKELVWCIMGNKFIVEQFIPPMLELGRGMKSITEILGVYSAEAEEIVEKSKVLMQKGIVLKTDASEEKKKDFFNTLMELSKSFDLLHMERYN